MGTRIVANFLLLFLFFLIKEYSFFSEWLGYMGNQKLMVIFIPLFITVNKAWKSFTQYFNVLSLKDIKLGVFLMLSATMIQVCAILLATHFHQTVFNQNQNTFPFWITPILEEIFFVGIVFNTIWWPFSGAEHRVGKAVVVPLLITFYWFILGRDFETVFLNINYPVSERLLSFPGATFITLTISVCLFIRTRSLIFSIIMHYGINVVLLLMKGL